MPRTYTKKSDYWQQARKPVIIEAPTPTSTQAAFDTTAGFDDQTHFSSTAACGGSSTVTNIPKDGAANVMIDSNAFRNLRSGIVPFEDVDGYYSVSTAIDLAVRAYFNVALVRNAINTMVDFSVSDIHVQSSNKNVKRFVKTWLKAAKIPDLMRQFFLEYYRSSNVFLYKFDGKIGKKEYDALQSLNVFEESIGEVKAARKEFATPKVPIKYILLNPSQVYLQRGAMASNGYVKMLSTYEIFRLKNPTTDEEKQMFNSFPDAIKQAIKKGGAFRYVYLPLEQERLFTAFYRKQDYEPLAIPMIFPLLNDIEWKLELKKMDMSIAKTVEQVILLVTTGRAADQYNQASSSKNQAALQELFRNQTIGRVLVADYTTKAEWKIPDLKEILGAAKYERVDKDIKEGLQYVFFGDEKFSNASIKVQMLIQGLEEGRRAFLDDFLNKEIAKVCEAMKFKEGARAYLEKIQMDNDVAMKKVYVQMATLGLLTPAELTEALDSGMLPSTVEALQHQGEWKKERDDGLWQPLLGGSGTAATLTKGQEGRPLGKSGPMTTPKANPTSKPKTNPMKKRMGKGSQDDQEQTSELYGDFRDRYHIGPVLMAENIVKLNAFRETVASELRKKFKVKVLNDIQETVAYTVARNIILTRPHEFLDADKQSEWKSAITACLENPTNLPAEIDAELDDIEATFEVNRWLATILHRSQI